jgi:hypothetical protein
VSALPAREPTAGRTVPGSIAAAQWAQIRAVAPQAAETIGRYLQRLAAFLAPGSVDAAENALRQFARWMITDAGLDSIAAVRRDDIEDYKVWLAAQPRAAGQVITAETHRQRVRTVRAFFERIIEWDWPDAPPRNPVIAGDIPKKPEPLPKFLDDRDAARLMAAARASTDPCDRLVVELLARTGGPASWPAWTPARSSRSAPGTGCASRWASSATTGTSRCTPSSQTCSLPGPPSTWSTSAGTSGWSPTTAACWTGTSSAASSPASPAPPESPACTRIDSATRWPPRPSTAACGWKPSPPCSATRKWR